MSAFDIMDAMNGISQEKVQRAIERMGYLNARPARGKGARRKTRVLLLAAVLALLLAACGYAVGRAINSSDQAFEITQQELQKMKDMSILSPEIAIPEEASFIMEMQENDGHMPDENYWYGRIFKHSYCVSAGAGNYHYNLFVDTMSGKITKLSIDASAQPDDEAFVDESPDWSGKVTKRELSMNFDDVVPQSITLDEFCALLSEYWGFKGYTLASTVEEEFYDYNTEVPDGGKRLADYANAPYLTVFFDGDQEGVPMYIELSSYAHPNGVYFTVGTNHAVG